MDYFRIAVSVILVAVFFYLFGYWSIIRLMDDGITVSQSQIEPVNIKPPGISLLILFLWAYKESLHLKKKREIFHRWGGVGQTKTISFLKVMFKIHFRPF